MSVSSSIPSSLFLYNVVFSIEADYLYKRQEEEVVAGEGGGGGGENISMT